MNITLHIMARIKLQRSGNTLTASDKVYKIFERKQTTPSKPKYFLVAVEGKKKKYISSLYGEPPEFSMEYQGNRYALTLSDSSAILTEEG